MPSRASLAATGFVSYAHFVNNTKPVGARLAREEAISNTKNPNDPRPTTGRHISILPN
jgi:hypothetical protein